MKLANALIILSLSLVLGACGSTPEKPAHEVTTSETKLSPSLANDELKFVIEYCYG